MLWGIPLSRLGARPQTSARRLPHEVSPLQKAGAVKAPGYEYPCLLFIARFVRKRQQQYFIAKPNLPLDSTFIPT